MWQWAVARPATSHTQTHTHTQTQNSHCCRTHHFHSGRKLLHQRIEIFGLCPSKQSNREREREGQERERGSRALRLPQAPLPPLPLTSAKWLPHMILAMLVYFGLDISAFHFSLARFLSCLPPCPPGPAPSSCGCVWAFQI